MRSVLVSGSYYPPAVGGIATMMQALAIHLGPPHVAVITGVNGPDQPVYVNGENVYRLSSGLTPASSIRTIGMFAKLAAILAWERPTVLQYATLEDAHIAYWTNRTLRMRHIFFAHGNEVLALKRSSWHKPREALLASSRVVAVSRFTEDLVKSIGVPGERIRILHPGCDTSRFAPVQVRPEDRARLTHGRKHRHVVLTVGNLVERKGHDMVMRAMVDLPPDVSNVLYVIAGEGPHRNALEELSRSLGIADRVLFLGRVSSDDLPLLYAMADVFVMLSRERLELCDVEGFGIVYIEAGASGTAAIGGRSGGVEDAIVDNVTGLLVDPHDPEELKCTLTRLLRDEALRRRLGDAARLRAKTHFTWSNFARGVADVLQEVANE